MASSTTTMETIRTAAISTAMARTVHNPVAMPEISRLTGKASRQLVRAISGVTLAMTLMACAGSPQAPTGGERTFEPSASVLSTDATVLPEIELPAGMLNEMVADAAARAGTGPEEVKLVLAESVTWSDGSIGCPEAGMMYTQALVPGYRVVLEVDGQQLNFHAAESGDFRFCESPQPPLERNPNE